MKRCWPISLLGGSWSTPVFFVLPGVFLAFDFLYSSLTSGEENERAARIANPVYDHGFAANFDGHDVWGDLRYSLATNSLGFKDASVRDVPLKPDSRRILLIGDSFPEAIGMSFEDSFVGQLYRTGQQRSEKLEFLNAAQHKNLIKKGIMGRIYAHLISLDNFARLLERKFGGKAGQGLSPTKPA